jgi:L,D-transpeptidase YcbB
MKHLIILILIFSGAFSGKAQNKSYAQRQIEGLNAMLLKYEKISAEEWKYLSCDPCIKKGDKDSTVNLLKKNLLLTKDLLKEEKAENNLFDEKTHNALVNFQKRNGLVPDGILGPQTIEALNIPFYDRIQQIKNEIEHWKDFGGRINEPYILVNIPDFSLQVIDSGRVIKNLKVIIGKQTTKTPVFQNEIRYLVINPSWVVPYSIATNEILPMLQNDPGYLSRNHMEVYTFYEGSKIKVNPDSLNWDNISATTFNYQVEQIPGPWNALGQIKFIFPNKYNIYLHDTPEKYLFSHPVRTYSHGCIRVEKPLELSAWLLHTSLQQIQELVLEGGESTIINLPLPIPIAIDYFTTWIEDDSTIQFRKDIYSYDSGITY